VTTRVECKHPTYTIKKEVRTLARFLRSDIIEGFEKANPSALSRKGEIVMNVCYRDTPANILKDNRISTIWY
jgi:hypothetical protein